MSFRLKQFNGDWFLVPEEMSQRFDDFEELIDRADNYADEYYELTDEFTEVFGEMEVNPYKLIIPDGAKEE